MSLHHTIRIAVLVCSMLAMPMLARGQASIDIASVPLQASGRAKPNLMLLLDDSDSMRWSYIGDGMFYLRHRIGFRSHLCNAQYYNPDLRYQIPFMPDGGAFPMPAFKSAFFDGFRDKPVVTDLSSNYRPWHDTDATPLGYDRDCDNCAVNGKSPAKGAAFYYRYIGSADNRTKLGSVRTSGSGSDDPCWYTDDLSSDASANWQRVTVDGISGPAGNADERQNFAIWYSFWRTRMLAMKSAISIAFQAIDEQFRVGFSTINYRGTDAQNTHFLDIADFNAAQQSTFHQRVQASNPDSATPLRAALSKAGRIFAGKLGVDPLQYSCQRNFSIIATDGAWNDGNETAVYGPLGREGKLVGNVDGALARPMFDGTDGATGPSNTLADVAAYYRHTDLRPGTCKAGGLCTDDVPGPDGRPTFQHMRTYAIGLGIAGLLKYADDYASAAAGDYADIVSGRRNWPDPTDGGAARVDDLWHAAVNGDGQYFNSRNIAQLQGALKAALDAIVVQSGADAPVSFDSTAGQGGRQVFTTSFRSSAWDGDLVASTVDPITGLPGARLWSAGQKLNQRMGAADDRRIYLYDARPASTNRLKQFTAASLADTEKARIAACGSGAPLMQCSRLSDAQKQFLNDNMVAFLRGTRLSGDVFRSRANVLGDIVNSAPVHVGRPSAANADSGYQDFAVANKGRREVVYVGANDGMLHAFSAATGDELWAYIPPAMLPRLARLADQRYASRHQFLVDGTVAVADICISASSCTAGNWRTILVGGFNAGGSGYYALDITDPDQPTALWNFNSDPGLGLSFGNPVFARLADGTWAVALTSGYNNASGTGQLYVLNAWTGASIRTIATGAGSAEQQSGLARIAAGIDDTGALIYGGDLLGNLWRFDLNQSDPAKAVARLASFAYPGATPGLPTGLPTGLTPRVPQPITTAPLLSRAFVGGQNRTLIVVGTGRYLGDSDKSLTGKQTLYVLQQPAGNIPLDDPRASMVARTLSEQSDGSRSIVTPAQLDWTQRAGWYLDLDPGGTSPGERINVDPRIDGRVLSLAGNVPSANPCSSGSAWFYALDFGSGATRAPTVGTAITRHDGGLLAGLTPRRVGNVMSMLLVSESGKQRVLGNWQLQSAMPKRVSWRQIVD
ncbi:pilus assembly protein [Lacisediminimonas profundi]|uniref:pilus assembly protein n=1 Tax=Lacisediminimonas profundi TaxID=2603856 RepID=UPI00124AE9E2|nr:PilC/PilY family type IV pilus protein [Lacisediminimonas profundi]